jgi:hypothetical protein
MFTIKLMRTKELIEAENKQLRTEYGNLFDAVAEILFRHDPIGINFESNRDEYEPEVRTILPRLKTCQSSEDVATVAFEEFERWFGSDIAGAKAKYRSLGEEIWNRWLERTKGRSLLSGPQA